VFRERKMLDLIHSVRVGYIHRYNVMFIMVMCAGSTCVSLGCGVDAKALEATHKDGPG